MIWTLGQSCMVKSIGNSHSGRHEVCSTSSGGCDKEPQFFSFLVTLSLCVHAYVFVASGRRNCSTEASRSVGEAPSSEGVYVQWCQNRGIWGDFGRLTFIYVYIWCTCQVNCKFINITQFNCTVHTLVYVSS